MPDEKSSKKLEIRIASIRQVLSEFSSEPNGIGLTVAIIQEGLEPELVIGFHKNYIIEEAENAIAFKIDLRIFQEVLENVDKRRLS